MKEREREREIKKHSYVFGLISSFGGEFQEINFRQVKLEIAIKHMIGNTERMLYMQIQSSREIRTGDVNLKGINS